MSESGKLDKTELKKIAKGMAIAGGGAVLTYTLEIIPSLDFGPYTLIVAAGVSTAINGALKWLQDNKE